MSPGRVRDLCVASDVCETVVQAEGSASGAYREWTQLGACPLAGVRNWGPRYPDSVRCAILAKRLRADGGQQLQLLVAVTAGNGGVDEQRMRLSRIEQ